MTLIVIVIFSTLLLIAYLFDLTSSKTKIPSVILLLMLGLLVNRTLTLFTLTLPDLSSILPILGTLGLILIVLEGALELHMDKTKLPLIKKSIVAAALPMMALALVITYLFMILSHTDFKTSLINAIPLCIISSAIAIPSVRNLTEENKEFVIYESSLSDIMGVLFFAFIAFNRNFDAGSFAMFGIEIVIITVISIAATILLSYLLNKIDHHIKFVPIILLIILIYAVAEIYHLPALIFILIFGLAIGNLDQIAKWKWIEVFKPRELTNEVVKFRDLTIEGAFLIRSLFFLLFGFLMQLSEILNVSSLPMAVGIVALIFFFRMIQLKLLKLPLKPLMFVAPRGLITILLFLSIDPANQIDFVNRALIIQIILISAIVMMVGIILSPGKGDDNKKVNEESPIDELADGSLTKTANS